MRARARGCSPPLFDKQTPINICITQHRKLLTAGTAAAAAAANEDEDEDGPYPDLPTVNLLAYDLVIYCAPPQVPPQQQEQQEGSAGDAAEAGCGLAEAQVKKALKALARRAVEDGELDVPFQLTAASTTVDLPVLRPALEEEMAEALAAVPDVGVDGVRDDGGGARLDPRLCLVGGGGSFIQLTPRTPPRSAPRAGASSPST